jgi:hypothetical protein
MKDDLAKFVVRKGEGITVRFADSAQVRDVMVNDSEITPSGESVAVTLPAAETISKLDVGVNPSRRTGPVRLEIQSGDRRYHHFILPDFDRVRFRFFYEEAAPKVIYCATEDDYVIADKHGKCPRHP